MSSNATTRRWWTSLAQSAVFRAAGVSVLGFVGWLWFSPADGSAGNAVALVAILALAALIGVAWYVPRARIERRWRTALDHYAELELAKGTHPARRARGIDHSAPTPWRSSLRERVVETA